jgi:UDP-N-acetylmuramate dehydrogenase
MSAIPGVAGATPIQNVGAYGQEIADVLVELDAYDTDADKFVVLNHDDCNFSYRNSIFKDVKNRHHIITSVTLRLSKKPPKQPFYPSLQKYLDENNITDYTAANIREAVIAIRAQKLPDPREIASAGSFFKNPIVPHDVADRILADFPDAPHWDARGDCVKLAAGWLIDQAGLKSYAAHGFQLFPKNALVVTNLNAKSAEDLEQFKVEIVAGVRRKFGVTLEQEPEKI